MKKLTIVLAVLAVVFLALSIVTASYSISRTEDAIDAIGEVHFDEASQEKIDLAESYFKELEEGGLSRRIGNQDVLTAAKAEYVRLAIKTAVVKDQRKTADGYTDEEIAAAVAAARAALDRYCGVGACAQVENYEDLIALEAQYAASGDSGTTDAAGSGSSAEAEEEEIELC